MRNDVKGLSLFNDIDDASLRNRNRYVVLANTAEAHTKQNKITEKGTLIILSYFNAIPEADKKEVYDGFKAEMLRRGYNV